MDYLLDLPVTWKHAFDAILSETQAYLAEVKSDG